MTKKSIQQNKAQKQKPDDLYILALLQYITEAD